MINSEVRVLYEDEASVVIVDDEAPQDGESGNEDVLDGESNPPGGISPLEGDLEGGGNGIGDIIGDIDWELIEFPDGGNLIVIPPGAAGVVWVPAPEPPATRHFMETPIDDFTVTEGLLLITIVFLALNAVVRLFGGRRL